MSRRRRLGQGDSSAAYLGVGDIGSRGPRPLRDTRYAVIDFENLVRKAKADGVITQDEAVYLTAQHSRLQQNSRDALRKMLEAYGYKQVVLNGDPGTPAAKLAAYISHGTQPRKITLPEPDVDTLFESVGRPMLPIFEGIGDAVLGRRRIPQKVTWLAIVGPAVLASLLGVLGIL